MKSEIPKERVCRNCGDRFCCRGLCKEMNEFLINRKKRGEKR